MVTYVALAPYSGLAGPVNLREILGVDDEEYNWLIEEKKKTNSEL